ncbi:hypothetical protein B0H14DRAFT_2580497 [Mycena olivaceomarginata]|nr:hypothetical protein B0H14DRAFT_2580497 [Mycena olivaceomarginata]
MCRAEREGRREDWKDWLAREGPRLGMTDETSEEMSIKAKVVVYGREKRTRQPSPSGMDGAMQQSLMEKEDHETNATRLRMCKGIRDDDGLSPRGNGIAQPACLASKPRRGCRRSSARTGKNQPDRRDNGSISWQVGVQSRARRITPGGVGSRPLAHTPAAAPLVSMCACVRGKPHCAAPHPHMGGCAREEEQDPRGCNARHRGAVGREIEDSAERGTRGRRCRRAGTSGISEIGVFFGGGVRRGWWSWLLGAELEHHEIGPDDMGAYGEEEKWREGTRPREHVERRATRPVRVATGAVCLSYARVGDVSARTRAWSGAGPRVWPSKPLPRTYSGGSSHGGDPGRKNIRRMSTTENAAGAGENEHGRANAACAAKSRARLCMLRCGAPASDSDIKRNGDAAAAMLSLGMQSTRFRDPV